MSTLLESLHRLASGRDGFEGLVAALLSELTGRQFFPAKAGYQGGRDFASNRSQSTVVAVECKRYGTSTALDARELLGEVEQAHQSIPDLDVWGLATSRPVSEQLYTSLRRSCEEKGFAFELLSTDCGLLELCASAPEVTLQFIGSDASGVVESDLRSIRKHSTYQGILEDLCRRFSDHRIGYDQFVYRQNSLFLNSLRTETEARASFHCRLPSPDQPQIYRREIMSALDAWYESWPEKHNAFLVLGEEGDGKTWATVSWLIHRIGTAATVPPVVFIPSHFAVSDDPYELVATAIDRHMQGPRLDWKSRIRRWLSRDQNSPTLLVVLDGLNEQRAPAWWCTLLETCAAHHWMDRVAMIMTCRPAYWQRLAELVSFTTSRYELGSYSDSEFQEALVSRNLGRNDVPRDLIPLVRRPRFFEVFARHAKAVAESGDFTIARLYYEDYNDRRSRAKSLQNMDNLSFADLLRELATRHRSRAVTLVREVAEQLPHVDDVPALLTELTTGGVLVQDGQKIYVRERHLQLGLGLLLADAIQSSSSDPEEAIGMWMGQDSPSDFQVDVVMFAIHHASVTPEYPAEACAALILAAFGSANRRGNVTAYLPLRPDAYRIATEKIFAEYRNPYAEDELLYAWLRWQRTPAVATAISVAISDWLSLVHLAGGLELPRDDAERVELASKEITQRLGQPIQPGPLTFCNRRFTIVARADDLRLRTVALTLVSHLPRERYLGELVVGAIADEVMGRHWNHDLFRWVLRTAESSICESVLASVQDLLPGGDRTGLLAAVTILECEGSPRALDVAHQVRSCTVEPYQGASESADDPCLSPFVIYREDCEQCLERTDVPLTRKVRMVSSYATDPTLRIQADLQDEFKSLAEAFDPSSMWCREANTARDNDFKELEPALCAFAATSRATLIRSVVLTAPTRNISSLRFLAFFLRSRLVALDDQAIDGLLIARTHADGSIEPGAELAELILTESLLVLLPAERQLQLILDRNSEGRLDSYETLFKTLRDFGVVRAEVLTAPIAARLRRLCWFISQCPSECPTDVMDELLKLEWKADSATRAFMFRLLYYGNYGDWSWLTWRWQPDQCHQEWFWGSLLIAKTTPDFIDIVERTHPAFLASAVMVRGRVPAEVNQLAEHLDTALTDAREQPSSHGNWLDDSYAGVELRAVISSRPDLVVKWAGSGDSATAFQRVPYRFLRFLCSALLRESPVHGVQAYRRIAWARPGSEPSRDLFLCEAHPSVVEEWTGAYDRASTDADLLELATVAWHGAAREWILDRIERELRSPVAFERARSVTLLGCVNGDESEQTLESIIRSSDECEWVIDLAVRSRENRRLVGRARHWYSRFLTSENSEQASSAFHLFLDCVDCRFVEWRADFMAEVTDLDHVRSAFLCQQEGEIRRKTEDRLSKLKKTLFYDTRVIRGAWPWFKVG